MFYLEIENSYSSLFFFTEAKPVNDPRAPQGRGLLNEDGRGPLAVNDQTKYLALHDTNLNSEFFL